jgi:Flp pilus assembly protein TadG
MVEFALSTPVLFLLLLAVVEFGRAFYQYNQLVSAARDAARYLTTKAMLGTTGVVSIGATDGTAAKYLAVYGNAAGSGTPLLPNLSISHVTVASDASNNVSVSIAYPYQTLFGGRIPTFDSGGSISTGTLTLRAYTSMLAL